MSEAHQINVFANGLCKKLWATTRDVDLVAMCKEYEAQVLALKTAAPARYFHVVNAVKFKRMEFKG